MLTRLFGFSCPKCNRRLRFGQLGPRFQCRVCGAYLQSNAGGVRFALTAAVVAVFAYVVMTGVWHAVFIAIVPVWAIRQLATKVWLDDEQPS